MLACRSSLSVSRSCLRAPSSRHFSTSGVVLARKAPGGAARKRTGEEDQASEDSAAASSRGGYKAWLAGEGAKYRDPKSHGTNWMGGDVPFPLNPTFKPPPPLSEAKKEMIFTSYDTDPVANSIPQLSQRHGISRSRIEAVIKLKELEQTWKKEGRQLQTGFLAGMERHLGVKQVANAPGSAKDHEIADLTDQFTHPPSKGYSRMFYEMVDEGKESTVAQDLEALAKQEVKPNAPKEKKQASKAVVKGSTVYIDVGNKFLDPREHRLREARLERKRAHNSRKANIPMSM